MRRLAVPVALLAAAAVLSLGVSLVLEAREPAPVAGPLPPRESMTVVSASVQPTTHAFGEPVVAELVAVADASVVNLDAVRVAPEFEPYESAGPAQVERTVSGDTARFRFRWPLRCLREGCAPDGERRTFEFPLGNVIYRFRSTPGPASALIDWPSFQVTARVGGEALAERRWRADETALPAVSYRWSPGTLAVVLLAAAAALAALGVGLAWWLAQGRSTAATADEEVAAPVLSPLERALELARHASRNGDSPERRRALERVARELGLHGHGELAERARALAWAPGGADPAAVDDLASRARATTNGGST